MNDIPWHQGDANLVPLRARFEITLFFSCRVSRDADHDPASVATAGAITQG
jgi:hypothetical protein